MPSTSLAALPTEIPPEKVFDARLTSCANKHDLIFGRWMETAVGDFFVLVNDHRPTPLQRQFERAFSGTFEWVEIAADPGFYAVRITRLVAAARHVVPPSPAESSEDAVLAWIEIDLSGDQNTAAAMARVRRTAQALRVWTGLRVFVSDALPSLAAELAESGLQVEWSEANQRRCYAVRRRDDPPLAESAAGL